MRSVFSEQAPARVARFAAVSAMALIVAACSTDTARFSEPMFASSNDYTGSITPRSGVGYGGVRNGAQGNPYGAPQPSVQQAPLAAPGSYPSQPYPGQTYQPAAPNVSGGYGQPAPVYNQPEYTPPVAAAPTYTPPVYNNTYGDGSPGSVSSIRSAAPRVTAPAGSGTWVSVEKGETLYSISRRYGVPLKALMQANNITNASSIRSGQRIQIPTYSASRAGWVTGAQPLAAATQRQVAVTPRPVPVSGRAPATRVATNYDRAPLTTSSVNSATGSHVVKTGETLYSISRRYGVTVEQLSVHNAIASPSQLRVGQRLAIPGSGSRVAAAPGQVATTPVPVEQPATVIQQQPAQPVVSPPQAAETAPINTAAIPPPQAINEGFRWPVRGRVINAFGDSLNGKTNEGINIAVPEGTSVRAAENGVVIYSGSELEGLGNLVLVRHSDNWVTAYAHARDLKVKRGDKVTRGQVIASAGQTGKVSSPQLHFELRKGSKPVDPLRYLSAL